MAVARRQTISHSGMPCFSLHDLADAVDTPLGVGERAVLLEERCARQEHVGELRRLVQEQVLHDEMSIDRKRVFDVMRVGVGLGDVLALDEHAAERAVDRGVEHVRNAKARLVVELDVPLLLEDLAHFVLATWR